MCQLWAVFDHFWGNSGINWINYDHIMLNHCMMDLIQQAQQYVWCFFFIFWGYDLVWQKKLIFNHFGSYLTTFGVAEGSTQSNMAHYYWRTVGKIDTKNPSHFLNNSFYFGEVTMWVWQKRWFWSFWVIFDHFWGNSEVIWIKCGSLTLKQCWYD